MKLSIPETCLVVLVGPSGSGKSTFARRHFRPTEILSSDFCRALVADDENDQRSTPEAFEVLHYIAAKRLQKQKLTVIDATNVEREARRRLVELARRYHCLPVALVFDLSERICHERNRSRPDRSFGPHVVRQQIHQLRRSIRGLDREGFRSRTIFRSIEEIEAVELERVPLWTDRRVEHGPFDIIGDVHGCFDELAELLAKLGYVVEGIPGAPAATPPPGRKTIFLGDLVDRGPATPAVLRLVMSMVEAGTALCVPGNHERKLLRKLRGSDVRVTHGLAESMAQLEREPPEFRVKVADFIDGLVSHFVLDGGKLVVAHAGMKEELQGRASARVREFAYFGETTGETDEFGLPLRHDWTAEYRGAARVVYGHTPVPEPEWLNRTICIDTGCVFGGRLTALRYPENELVSVPAKKVYYQAAKPFLGMEPAARAVDRARQDVLDISDVLGKRVVSTRYRSVTVREENAVAALEVMTRWAVDPRFLVYLPPTMSPCATRPAGEYLEHPSEAFSYFRSEGVPRVVCQEKHMGSRAVIVACRDASSAETRFGIEGETCGSVFTRTGRPFFADEGMEVQLLDRLRKAMENSGLWEELGTAWVCLDAELMPWSVKAQELLREQYAATAAASRHALADAVGALELARLRNGAPAHLVERYRGRARSVEAFARAYRRFCWTVRSIDDLKLAPFHLLASEGKVHTERDHVWHMNTLARLCRADEELLTATDHRVIDVTDPDSERAGVEWWEELTGRGGEGMVVKPVEWIVRGRRGMVQPAVKCRGREYLRIIYGAEYTAPEHIERLRSRALGAKRSLAVREFALGLEALHRFVENEPLYRVHECVFGVLALESEPVDPRL